MDTRLSARAARLRKAAQIYLRSALCFIANPDWSSGFETVLLNELQMGSLYEGDARGYIAYLAWNPLSHNRDTRLPHLVEKNRVHWAEL
jgi:hypothetical protein